MHEWVKLKGYYFENSVFCRLSKAKKSIFLFSCVYLRDGSGFINGCNSRQQQRLHKPTFSAENALVKVSVGPG